MALPRSVSLRRLLGVSVLGVLLAVMLAAAGSASAKTFRAHRFGELDCNGFSTLQHPLAPTMKCADVRGFPFETPNLDEGRFSDNGHYIGHDEPDMTFLSSGKGSGNNVTWTETIGKDPKAPPTDASPGHDVTHWFELSVAPWFSMDVCDPKSYPQGAGCTPNSDSNAPTCVGADITDCNPGAGAAFMEMQFYPPGEAPFQDNISCDNTHWCSALTIDSLECNLGFRECNAGCEEPVNFAFIQRNGVPAGPPSPQEANVDTFRGNRETLLMNPGDKVTVHMFDAPAPGGGMALKIVVKDLTTGQSGFMQASAANGFHNTSMKDCSGTPFNFQPEFSTAKSQNVAGWTALATNVSTQFEIGHWEPCTSLTDLAALALSATILDPTYLHCHGPYESAGASDTETGLEPIDAPCFPRGDTHGDLRTPPNVMTGCTATFAGGDLDFDGNSYWPDWPVREQPTEKFPGSFVQRPPVSEGFQYSKFFIQTDTALSEATCATDSTTGCTIPPQQAPGNFYPYWSRANHNGDCAILFGNVSSGPGVNSLGGDAQYGTDQIGTLGYHEFEGPVQDNTCTHT